MSKLKNMTDNEKERLLKGVEAHSKKYLFGSKNTKKKAKSS